MGKKYGLLRMSEKNFTVRYSNGSLVDTSENSYHWDNLLSDGFHKKIL
jgi:hypothetical protein